MKLGLRMMLPLVLSALMAETSHGLDHRWTSGIYPTDIGSCPWELYDDASPENPALSGGKLTISTSADLEHMYYIESTELAVPSLWVMDAVLKVVSENHQSGPRRGVSISFRVAPNKGNILYIGLDQIFLWGNFGVQGPSASVDTDGGYHQYRIEIQNQSVIRVFHDGVLVLNGAINMDSRWGAGPEIAWGDATGNARGVSEWLCFSHNGSTCEYDPGPCSLPTPIELMTWSGVKMRLQ
jgi:hypothetical protein